MKPWLRVCASFEEEAEADREYWQQFSPAERVALIEPQPSREQIDFVSLLAKRGVRALVVGVHAVGFHARPRYTSNLEILIETSADTFADAREGIDVMTNISGVTFSEAWEHRVEGTLGGQPVFFIGKEELMRNKSAAGRHEDLADLDLLRRF